ncbi:MAG: 5'-nucleotidase, lipoprotein e(P4) family [Bacteroidia bacterium]|nr:5'-nucleotidase, lipoprotein e(P4) family [Bacteroidia bacterium]
MTTLAIIIDVCIMILKKVILFTFIFISLNSFAQEAGSVKVSTGEDLRVYPVLWHQLSPEYMALCYQAFNVAQSNLEKELQDKECCEKLAIVTDIDETVLDNSYSEARNIAEGKSYNFKDWTAWIDEASATAIPGAVDFLRWAESKGVTVFYISNRTPRDIPGTVKNLKNLNFPFADEEHMLFLADGSTKEPRREKVAENYKIVMLLGDNLNDFAACFEVKDNQKRRDATVDMRQEWGRRFIVIPNVIYGEWEKGIYDYKSGLSSEDKAIVRKGKLKVNP